MLLLIVVLFAHIAFVSMFTGLNICLDGVDGGRFVKVICHIILGIPMLILYIPCMYILVLVEHITLNVVTIFTERNHDTCHLFHAIDNISCKYFVYIFVYIPMMPVYLLPILTVLLIMVIRPRTFSLY